MSIFRSRSARNESGTPLESAEDEALSRESGGFFYPAVPTDYHDGPLGFIRDVILPLALERGDANVAATADAMLEEHGMMHPNVLSGRWEAPTEPRNEVQLREMCASRMREFGYEIIRSRDEFPDWLLKRSDGVFVRAEVELLSASFVRHGHDPDACDLVVCWVHDGELTLPVLELSTGQCWGVVEARGVPSLRSRPNPKRARQTPLPKATKPIAVRRKIVAHVSDLIDSGLPLHLASEETAHVFDVSEAVVRSHYKRSIKPT